MGKAKCYGEINTAIDEHTTVSRNFLGGMEHEVPCNIARRGSSIGTLGLRQRRTISGTNQCGQ
eukprot:3738666-Lingulodinium_polyedra.AAC.1